jgi:hypothetical protein
MKRDEVEGLLPIIQAFGDGKEIQFLNHDNKWVSMEGMTVTFSSHSSRYRIKPEPTYRAFANEEEFEPHCDKWISRASEKFPKSKGYLKAYSYDENGIWCSEGRRSTYAELFNEGRKFKDGTPFGVLVKN